MNLHLIDDNADVANALTVAFKSHKEVNVATGDLLGLAKNCVVSPANSQGFMDGGIDRAFVSFFGAEIELKVREAVGRVSGGRILVGSSIVVSTGHPVIPYLLVAPTMEHPEPVDALNAYRAMRAVLRIASAHAEIGRAVFCPGLCTGVGGVSPCAAAAEMLRAYDDWKHK